VLNLSSCQHVNQKLFVTPVYRHNTTLIKIKYQLMELLELVFHNGLIHLS
jgi:hypothetical protein